MNFEGFKKGLKTLGVGAILAMPAKSEALNTAENLTAPQEKIENVTENNSLDNSKNLELSKEYSAWINDFENFEAKDSIPDKSGLYGYKFQGQIKIFAGTFVADYYGFLPGGKVNTENFPVFRQIKKTEEIFKLGDVNPHMGSEALYANFDSKGRAHLVSLPDTVSVFRDEKGNTYAQACGNLLIFMNVKGGEKQAEKIEQKNSNNQEETKNKSQQEEQDGVEENNNQPNLGNQRVRVGGVIRGGSVRHRPGLSVPPPRTWNPHTGGWDGPRRWDLER